LCFFDVECEFVVGYLAWAAANCQKAYLASGPSCPFDFVRMLFSSMVATAVGLAIVLGHQV